MPEWFQVGWDPSSVSIPCPASPSSISRVHRIRTEWAQLKDGELDWISKELLILRANHRYERPYCVVPEPVFPELKPIFEVAHHP